MSEALFGGKRKVGIGVNREKEPGGWMIDVRELGIWKVAAYFEGRFCREELP